MEIRRIDPYTYENFDRYMLVMPVDSIEEMQDICSMEIDGKLYIVCRKEDTLVFVENDDGYLNPFEVELDKDGDINGLDTESFKYLFKSEGFDTFIQRKNKLSLDVDSLALIKNQGPEPFLEYRQFIYERFSVLIRRYRTLAHSVNSSAALNYTNYHLPTHLELHESRGNIFFAYDKKKFFFLTEDEKTYRRAYIVRDRSYHLASLKVFDGEKLIDLIANSYGFQREIDQDLKKIVYGENQEYNKTRKLVDTYQNYILGQK